MAEYSKSNINGVPFDLKDAKAREKMAELDQRQTATEGRLNGLTNIPEGSEAASYPEIRAARVDGAGKTYDSLGDAMLAQVPKSDIVQDTGNSPTAVMSQKATSAIAHEVRNIHYRQLENFKCYGNMLGVCSLEIKEGYYATSIVGQKVKYFENASYTAHLLKVKQTEYYFKDIRFISVLDENGLSLYYASDASSIDVSQYPLAKYLVVCSLGNSSGVFEGSITDVKFQSYCYPVKSKPSDCEFLKLDGGTDYRGYFYGLITSRNKSVLVLSFNFTSFTELNISFVKENNFASPIMQIRVTDTALINVAPDTGVTVAEHGLTIRNNLQIVIPMGFEQNLLRLVSNGVEYSRLWYPRVTNLLYPAINLTSEYTNLRASFTSPDFNAKYWLFGDSYFTDRKDRWVYYLRRDEQDKDCMIDGFPGETSAKALQSFKTSLYYGTPEKAVWCLGMNNRDNGAINAEWLSCAEEFLKICELNDITPILATIPNTPTVDNSYKNEWVKNSGVRYVDFASAVQVNGNEWYEGMLSSDMVHPTETGAITLYYKFLTDFPEVYQ